MNALQMLGALPIGRVIVLSLVISGLYYLVGYDGGAQFQIAIDTANKTLQDLEVEDKKLEVELQEIRALKAAQEKDSEQLNMLLAFIPEKFSNFELMRTLSNEAKAVGVDIDSLKDVGVLANKGAEFYAEIGVDIEIDGSFAQLLLFLSNLTKLKQIVTLDTLSLRTVGSQSSDSQLTMSAQVRGYRYVAPKDGAKK